jgi:Fuc2NAc and GlcNAc transferase
MQPTGLFLLAVFAVAFVSTGLATWLVTRLGMLDLPGDRHSHSVATPRGGGLGIVLAIMAGAWFSPLVIPVSPFWWHCLAPAFLALALLGLLDDRYSLPIVLRLLVQLAASFYLLACFRQSGWVADSWLWMAAGLFLVWMTNLYNFMDGSNGMAAMQAVFAGVVIAVLSFLAGDASAALLAAILVAACGGFLPWNLGRARVFMGDVGSISLGFLLGAMLIHGVLLGSFSPVVAWMVMAVFVCDSTLTLLARVIRGERWYTPHKQHTYQRLIAKGWSHLQVMWLYQLINLLLVVPGIVVAVNYPEWAGIIAISITSALAIAWFLAMRKFGVLA